MRFVAEPVDRPNTCAIIPGWGASSERGRWIDLGHDIPGWDPHAYASEAGARELARFIGWLSPDDAERAVEQIDALEARVAELEAENAALALAVQAVDGMTRHGYVVRKAPGRKPKAKEEVLA